MALQSLTTTTTPTLSGTETTAPEPAGSGDANANANNNNNSGLLGPNGPQPLVPAFVLSGLLIAGVVVMCWWKRLAARRLYARNGGGVSVGGDGEEDVTRAPLGPRPRPRISMVIGAGRGMGPGMIFLAARGADLRDEALALQGRRERREKEVELGPKPVLWDVHLGNEELVDTQCRWREMKPLSASYVPPRARSDAPLRDASSNAFPSSASFETTRTRWSRRHPQIDPMPTNTKSKIPESQPQLSSSSTLRISTLISMPTPREGLHARHVEAEEHRNSNMSSEGHDEVDGIKRERLGELNIALGITEVESGL